MNAEFIIAELKNKKSITQIAREQRVHPNKLRLQLAYHGRDVAQAIADEKAFYHKHVLATRLIEHCGAVFGETYELPKYMAGLDRDIYVFRDNIDRDVKTSTLLKYLEDAIEIMELELEHAE